MVESIQTLQSLAQSGQAYTKDPYDRQRFDSIKQICARLLQEVAGLSQAQAESLIFDEEGYRTPKVDVRGTVFQDQRILLVQEEADGLWCLPGGWADLHETRADRLVMFLNSDRHGPKQFYQAYKLFFLCELIQGECRPTTDTSAVAFFAADVLPALSTRRTTREQILRLFEHDENRCLPADFD